MEDNKVFIKIGSPKDRDDFFEAIAIYITENFERSLAIKRKACLLAGYPEMTAKEEAGERRYILRASEIIPSFFLREIYEDEFTKKLAKVMNEEVPINNAIIHKNKDGSVSICNRKELPTIKWQAFPEDAAELVNAAIGLSKKKGITLKEFFRSKDHYKEMIISLHGKPNVFALEITLRVSEFFELKTSECIFMDVLADSENTDQAQDYAKANRLNRPEGRRIALAGAIIAIESAMEIFGKNEMQEKKLIVLKEKLEELKKTVVPHRTTFFLYLKLKLSIKSMTLRRPEPTKAPSLKCHILQFLFLRR